MPPKRWILLLAVSSGPQAADDKESLPSQERDLRAYVESVGGVVIDIIRIPGFSRDFYTWAEFAEAAANSKDKLTDPKRMIDHWQRRDFDAIAMREMSRAGRKISIIGEFIGKTIDAGAFILPLNTGTPITSTNGLTSSMIEGYVANQELNTLKGRRKFGMEKRVSRGLPSSRVPATHYVVRDPLTGDPAGPMIVKTEARVYFARAAQHLTGAPGGGIDPVSYDAIERILTDEGHHLAGIVNRPGMVHRMLFSPSFWGHSAQYFNDQHTDNRQKAGLWMLDNQTPAPSGVKITYDTHEAVLTGDAAAALKGEMKRRTLALAGRAQSRSVTMFTGLIACAECFRSVSRAYTAKTQGGDLYRCTTHSSPKHGIYCSQSVCAHEHHICAWLNKHILTPLLTAHDYSVLMPTRDDTHVHYQSLQDALLDAESRLYRLIEGQSRASTVVFDHYARQINSLSTDIETYKRGLLELEGQIHQSLARKEAIERVAQPFRLYPHAVWELPVYEINQFLFAIMGDKVLAMRGGHIVGLQNRLRQREKTRRIETLE